MIGIQLLDGTPVVLDSTTRIRYKRRAALFYQDVIPTDYSFPFTLPIRGNETLFDYGHLIQSYRVTSTREVLLTIGGNTFARGELHLNDCDENYFECEFSGRANGALDGSQKINALFTNTLDGSVLETPGVANTKGWPEVNFCYPCYINLDEYFVATYKWHWVNRHNSSGYVYSSPPDKVPLGMSLYLGYVLIELCEQLGFTAKGDVFDDEELMSIHLWNNYVFEYNGGNYLVDEQYLVPDETLNDFLVKLKKWLGLRIVIDYKRHVIHFDKLKDFRDKSPRISVDGKLYHERTLKFPKENGHAISLQFDDGHNSSVTGKEDVSVDGVYDISQQLYGAGLPVGEFHFCTADNAIYRIDDAGNPELYRYEYEPALAGDEDESISVECGTLTEWYDNTDIQSQLLPTIDHPITDVTQRNPFKLKLLFYRGIQEGAVVIDSYPASSAYILATQLAAPQYVQVGNYSLYPNGPYGTYEQFWRYHIEWLQQAKVVESMLHLTYADLMNWDDRNLLSHDGTNYVWEELDIVISTDGIEATKVKMRKA